MKRFFMSAATAVLCACGTGNATHATPTDSPDLRSTTQYTRVEMPGGAIEIDWQHQRTYDEKTLLVGVDKAWSEYPTVFGELGISPTIVDQKQHVFGNAGMKLRGSLGGQRISKYLECGATAGMSNADTYDIFIRVISQVVPGDGGLATLRTQIEGNAHSSGVSAPAVNCASTGALEARIAHMMSELAAKPGN